MEVTYVFTVLAFAFPLMIAIGVAILVRRFRGSGQQRRTRLFSLIAAAMLAIACVILVAFFIFSPSLGERRQTVDRIVRLPRAEVSSVVITPYPNPGYASLVAVPVTITASSDLEQIVDALHSARDILPNHPQAIWSALIQVSASTGDRSFIVEYTGTPQNGTLIHVDSNVTYGWHIADLRCDDLGVILQGLTTP